MIWKVFKISVILLSISCLTMKAQSNNTLLVESGKIEYMFGSDFSGSETFYFENFGYKEYHITIIKGLQNSQVSKTKTIVNDDKLIGVDLVTGKANLSNLDGNTRLLDKTKEILIAGNFTKSGEETIAGITCEKYEGVMGTLFVWKGIILKSEVTIADKKLSKTAVIVDTITTVPANVFKIE